MPIQNRKIKLTLIFLLILLSISAFSIIGIVVAFNTKQQSDPPKAAAAYDIKDNTSLTESIYNSYSEFNVYSLTPIFKYVYSNAETLAYDKLTFKGKKLYLKNNITRVENNPSYVNSGMASHTTSIFAGFAGVFDGQGHTISNISITNQKGPSLFCKTLCTGGVVKNVKFASNPSMWIASDILAAGIVAIEVEEGATIQSCIIDGAGFYSKANNSGTVAGAIAAYNSGTIKNCIVQGTIYYGAANAAFVDYNLKVYGIAGSNSGTIKDNVVTANTHKYDGDANGMTYDSDECSYGGNNNSYSSLANAKGKLIERSSVGGSHSSENNYMDWYEHPGYNSGNPYLRAFISWKDVFIKTTLNGSDNSDCGYITGEPTEIKVPTSVTLPSINSTEATVKIWGVDYTATAYNHYKFAGWSGSGTTFSANFNHVPVRVKFGNPYDLMIEDESDISSSPASAYLPLKHNSVITCDNDISDDNKLTYEFTNVTFGGITESKRTVTYNINSEIYKFENSFRISTQKEDGTWEVEEINNGPYTVKGDLSDPEKIVVKISPVVRRKGTPIIFNPISINNGQTTISPTNNGENLSDNTIIMPINSDLECSTEDYTKDGYSAQKIVYNIRNSGNNKFKVVYDLGIFYQKSDFGLELNQSGLYNIEADCDLEVNPTVNQIAMYLSFGNVKIKELDNNAALKETTICSDVDDSQFLLTYNPMPTITRDISNKNYIKYTFNSKDGTEHTVTYDITAFKGVGFEFLRQNIVANGVYGTMVPQIQQKEIRVTFNSILNNQVLPNYIVPVVNYRDESYDNGFSILLDSSIANSITCEYDKYNKVIEYYMNNQVYASYLIEDVDIVDVQGNPVDYSVLDDFTFDNTGDMGITKTTTTVTTNMVEGNSYSLITITVSPQLMYKIYGGSYGGAQ